MIHNEQHPRAGETVIVSIMLPGDMEAREYTYVIEDWWDRVTNGSWMYAEGNPAALLYAKRSADALLPLDDEVVYGKINGLGYIVHTMELQSVTEVTE